MKKRTLRITALLMAMITAFSLTACGSSSGDSVATENEDTSAATETSTGDTTSDSDVSTYVRQTEEGTLTVGTTQSTDTFDIAGGANYMGEQLVYETLFYIDPVTSDPVGLLAEEWEYQDDTHLYIKIYDDANFSNGDTVTCEDVIWSWYRTVEEQSSEVQNLAFINFDDIEYISDKEMVIGFNYTFEPAVNYMAMFTWASVMCKSAMENASADDYWSNPIGSGPYTVVENVSGSGCTYALRDNYWNEDLMPEAETIYVKSYSDASTMMIDYETGALDVCFNLTTNDAERVINGEVEDTNYELLNDADITAISYCEYTESLQDVNVRKALDLAIDKQTIVDVVWGDLGEVTNSVIPSMLDESLDCFSDDYDPDQAIELLEAAGYNSSNPLELNVVIVGERSQLVDLATMVQEQWAAVGVTLTIDSCDLATAISHYMNEETDIVFDQGGGICSYSAYEILQMWGEASSNTTIKINDPDFIELVNLGGSTLDADEHDRAYTEAQQYLADNCWRTPLAETYSIVIYRPYVSNVDSLGGGDNMNVRWVYFN